MATARIAPEISWRRARVSCGAAPHPNADTDASLRLFSEKGFARTSVRDIAQAAGITDAAIHYHFASKRDLFEALIEERGFTAALEGLERAEITVGPREAITGIAIGALEFIYGNRDLMKVLMLEAMAEDPVAAEEYRILFERWARAEARILRHYAEHGQLRTEAIDELATQLVLTVLGVFADYLMKPAAGPAPDTPPAGPHAPRRSGDAAHRPGHYVTRFTNIRPLEAKAPAPTTIDDARFAHESEEEFARLLDFYGVRWQYEPRTFPLRQDDDGRIIEAFSPTSTCRTLTSTSS